MVFNSLGYFLFLPLVFLVHHFSPNRLRWLVLLVASFVFYGALKAPHLIIALLLVTSITYAFGILLSHCNIEHVKFRILWSGIAVNVSVLIGVRYLPFFTARLNSLLNLVVPDSVVLQSDAIIAIGVSYFVFQAISYLVDIYLEVEKPERNYFYFALYMSFFPKLLQGPIERCGNLLPQLKQTYSFNYENVRTGLFLFALGLVKKLVVADRLAQIVNPVFENVHAYKGFPLLLATYYYSLQIYLDFSGYTDMALGTALLFNIKLVQNFNKPYLATSIAEFWRRWHISFSSWILDYIFKPLQMSWRNSGKTGVACALLITFIISGVWHGASLGFVAWGALHGIYMVSAVLYKPYQNKLYKYFKVSFDLWVVKVLRWFFTFNMVCFAWVFFRANSLYDAVYVIKMIIIAIINAKYAEIAKAHGVICGVGSDKYYSIIIIIIIMLYLMLLSKLNVQKNSGITFRWLNYVAVSVIIVTLGVYGAEEAFLYLKF